MVLLQQEFGNTFLGHAEEVQVLVNTLKKSGRIVHGELIPKTNKNGVFLFHRKKEPVYGVSVPNDQHDYCFVSRMKARDVKDLLSH